MVAQLKPQPERMRLLFEPDYPDGERAVHGWRRAVSEKSPTKPLVREGKDDDFGAQIQHAVAKYYLTPYRRSEMARDLSVSPRQAQAYLGGRAWGQYARPVLRALKRLGVRLRRGDWLESRHIKCGSIIAAQRATMRHAIDALEGSPLRLSPDEREQLLADLRLLTIAPGDDA